MPRGDADTGDVPRNQHGQMKETAMLHPRVLAVCAIGALLLAATVEAQDLLVARALGASALAQYRNFALTSDLATVATAAGVAASAAATIHQRPALLQDLEWRPSRWLAGSLTASTYPVDRVVFSFYDNQLFRVVVDYASDRTEGLTNADMVEAIAAVYGTPGKQAAEAAVPASRAETESGAPVARWADAGHTIVLYRSSTYRSTFRLILTDRTLARLARKASAESDRLDQADAPRREAARVKKEQADGRAAAAKARAANKGSFRP